MNINCIAAQPPVAAWLVGVMVDPDVRGTSKREAIFRDLAEALVPPPDWRDYRPIGMGSGHEAPDFGAADFTARRRLDAAEKHVVMLDGHALWSGPYCSRREAESHVSRYALVGLLVGIVATEVPPPERPASMGHADLFCRLHEGWVASERETAKFALGQYADSYFGMCPLCFKEGVGLNVGREHWLVCDEHRVKWFVGSNLFSGWRDESEDTHRENAETLRDHREVEPRHYKPRIAAIVAERQREIDEARAARALGTSGGAKQSL